MHVKRFPAPKPMIMLRVQIKSPSGHTRRPSDDTYHHNIVIIYKLNSFMSSLSSSSTT